LVDVHRGAETSQFQIWNISGPVLCERTFHLMIYAVHIKDTAEEGDGSLVCFGISIPTPPGSIGSIEAGAMERLSLPVVQCHVVKSGDRSGVGHKEEGATFCKV
uniref:C2 tensin-type domain-containing protein n=1 Tax=Gongylonema pulchrum TaxID=637853 RepID=A0A183EQL5_9BILA